MLNPNAQAAYQRARDRVGVPVTFQRVNGNAPNTNTVSANVVAVVRDYAPDFREVARTGYGSSSPGAITQGDREVIVLEQDLADQRFPLPVKKNDKIVVVGTGEQLNI